LLQCQLESQKRKVIAVGIPSYNEQEHELQRTLESLEVCYNYKLNPAEGKGLDYGVDATQGKGYYMTAIIILDGLNAMHETMRSYMERLFECKFDEPGGPLAQTAADSPERGNCTFIIERKPRAQGEQHALLPGLHLYLLVKRDNRKKHNSHEWFLKSFCSDLDAYFAFCTDCGTFYDEKCMKRLVQYLETNDECSACCGRQRIMPKHIQDKGDPVRDPTVNSPLYSPTSFTGLLWEAWLRSVQCYDFESSHAVDKPAFSVIGLMPVLPGPCGLFKYGEIKGEAVHKHLTSPTENSEFTNFNWRCVAAGQIFYVRAQGHRGP
jgi:cellulose synthase/poly-beta-1,6-N-acetylglucosamine synthase-like glycosyltransferase